MKIFSNYWLSLVAILSAFMVLPVFITYAAATKAPSFPDAPLATAARFTKTPKIDGRPDDTCWKHTVAIKDFILFGSHIPAPEPTSVRLGYDENNLYVLVRCTEPLLLTAAQSQSDVISKVHKRDGKVLSDDSFLIFIQPNPDERKVYEFTVNTLGILLDAKMSRDNLWRTRNVKWNSKAQVAVKRYDGYWIEEMSIPLADLGINKIKPGQKWRIGLDRIAQSRHELSSWQPTMANGAHAPVELGALVFSGDSASINPKSALNHLEPGENNFSVSLGSNISNNSDIVTQLSNTKNIDVNTFSASGKRIVDTKWLVKHTGNVNARWEVWDKRRNKPIYVSPVIALNVQSSQAALDVSASGKYQVKLNGRLFNKGARSHGKTVDISLEGSKKPLQWGGRDARHAQKGGRDARPTSFSEFHFHLKKGINVIQVISQSGTAKLALRVPWKKRFNSNWRTRLLSKTKNSTWQTDDSNWQIAKLNKSGEFGKIGAPRVFRKTILVDYTNVWPVPHPAWYIAGNTTQQVTFTAQGIKNHKLNNWITYLAVPKGLKVVGSTGYYGNYVKKKAQLHCSRAGNITIDGKTVPLYKIKADKPMIVWGSDIMSIFQVMFQIANPKYAKKGVTWTIHFWSAANNGTTIQPPKSFEMRALPPVHGVQPKKFILQLWGGPGRMDNEKLRKTVLDTAVAAGFNMINATSKPVREYAKKAGIKDQAMISFKPWSLNMASFTSKHPKARLVGFDGKPSKQQMCMSLLLGKDWHVVAAQLKKQIKKLGYPDVLIYDYEYNPFTGPHSCYDDRCLSAFRHYVGLAQSVELTPKIIKSEYQSKWEDFMAYRVAKMFARMKQTIHRLSPDTKFSIYSGYQSKTTVQRYGIDWRYVGQFNAADFIGCGYGRSIKRIHDTLVAARGIPTMLGVLLHPYKSTDMRPASVATKAVILRRALDATGGILVYTRKTMDGRSWSNVAAISRLISKYEPLFLNRGLASLRTIAGQNPSKVVVVKGANVNLVCVININSKPAKFSFTLPKTLGAGHEFFTGKKIKRGAQINITVPGGGVKVYVLH